MTPEEIKKYLIEQINSMEENEIDLTDDAEVKESGTGTNAESDNIDDENETVTPENNAVDVTPATIDSEDITTGSKAVETSSELVNNSLELRLSDIYRTQENFRATLENLISDFALMKQQINVIESEPSISNEVIQITSDYTELLNRL